MSKSYTPGLKVLEKTSIQKERILPLRGKVHANEGDEVDANDVVASTKIPGNVQMVNVANELNIDPDQISDCMLCLLDESLDSRNADHRETIAALCFCVVIAYRPLAKIVGGKK